MSADDVYVDWAIGFLRPRGGDAARTCHRCERIIWIPPSFPASWTPVCSRCAKAIMRAAAQEPDCIAILKVEP